jgi:hypothetical protein
MRFIETNTASGHAPLRSVAGWVLAATLVPGGIGPALAQNNSVVQLSSPSDAAFEHHTELT